MAQNMIENSKNESNQYADELKRGLSLVENKERALNSRKFIEDNKLKQVKSRFIQQMFAMMKELGVDPSNPESVSKFLGELSQKDPDLLALFEEAFNNISSEDAPQPTVPTGEVQAVSPEQGGITDNFNNLRNIAFNR